MQIIVVGCGKVGSRFAQLMSEEGHDIVVVDNDSENFRLLDSNFKGLTVLGVPIDEDVLKQAGIESADGLAAVTPDDNINMMACQIAKEIFNVPRIFARIQDPVREQVFYQFGVHTVCPTNMTVQEFRALMMGEVSATACYIDNNIIDFEYHKVKESDVGKLISDIIVPKDNMILGLIKDGKLQFSSPSLKLGIDDEIVIVNRL
jgi:K+ transport systems, NAD-binding component